VGGGGRTIERVTARSYRWPDNTQGGPMND